MNVSILTLGFKENTATTNSISMFALNLTSLTHNILKQPDSNCLKLSCCC